MPWPFSETERGRCGQFPPRADDFVQPTTQQDIDQSHLDRYQRDREHAEHQRRMLASESRMLNAMINERSRRHEGAVGRLLASDSLPSEDLPPYQGASSAFRPQHVLQESSQRQNTPHLNAYQGQSSQQTSSLEDQER